MDSRKLFVLPVLLFVIKTCQANVINLAQTYTDYAIPIPEITVTIGGSLPSFPLANDQLVLPVINNFESSVLPTNVFSAPNYQLQPNVQPFYPEQIYPQNPTYPFPQQQVIILDDAEKKSSLDMFFLLMLLGNKGSNNGCYNDCNTYNGGC